MNWVRTAIPNAFRTVKDRLSSIWGGLRGIAQRSFDGIKGAVRGPLNAVIGIVNSAIGSLNRIRVSVPGWVPEVGGRSFGVSLPRIPALAAGGVVLPRSGGVPAILAEAGEAEAVLPLSKLDRLLSRAAAHGTTGGPAKALHIEHYYATEHSSPQRTVVQTAVGLCRAAGVPETLPWVAGALAVAAGVTRVMAVPGVQALLPGWLRTDPRADTDSALLKLAEAEREREREGR